MYGIKVRVLGKLSEMLVSGYGRVVRTPKGDICVFRSLAVAEEVDHRDVAAVAAGHIDPVGRRVHGHTESIPAHRSGRDHGLAPRGRHGDELGDLRGWPVTSYLD
jgi:hypothetical protein